VKKGSPHPWIQRKFSKSIFFVHKSTEFEALSRSTEVASGEWLGRECSAEVTADAEL
jgi:hypothetical protein